MVQRALVMIGVSQPGGGLDALQSIPGSMQRMVDWATGQQFQRIVIHTDVDLSGLVAASASLVVHSNAPVRIGDISDTIEQLDSAPVPPAQLIVYFNGHGLRSNSFGDLWLLSKAPQQESEAVSLYASVMAAQYGTFNHVVLISDACRVPPDTAQFSGVRGSSIFVNRNFDVTARVVDQFFAATVGAPALEVRVDGKPCSIYTLQLSDLLLGSDPTLLEVLHAPEPFPKVLRTLSLKTALAVTVRARLLKNGYSDNVRPDAIVMSTADPNVWISSFDRNPGPLPAPTSAPPPPSAIPPDEAAATTPPAPTASPQSIIELQHAAALEQMRRLQQMAAQQSAATNMRAMNTETVEANFRAWLKDAADPPAAAAPATGAGIPASPSATSFSPPPVPQSELTRKGLAAALAVELSGGQQQQQQQQQQQYPGGDSSSGRSQQQQQQQQPPQRQPGLRFPTGCGIRVEGPYIQSVLCAGQSYGTSPTRQTVVSVNGPATALVTLQDGSGLLLPLYAGHIAHLVMPRQPTGYAVESLAYEPADDQDVDSPEQRSRYSRFAERRNRLEAVRAALMTAAAAGGLQTAVLTPSEVQQAVSLARYSMQDADPILLTLLAYACAATGQRDLLVPLVQVAVSTLRFIPFDMLLLASIGHPILPEWQEAVLPPFPLIAQGWALLQLSPLSLPIGLRSLSSHLQASPFTMLTADGVQLCKDWLNAEETSVTSRAAAANSTTDAEETS